MNSERCFACDKPILNDSRCCLAITIDLAQVVSVGPDCFKKIRTSGDAGYQPPKGGPRLLVLTREREAKFNQEYGVFSEVLLLLPAPLTKKTAWPISNVKNITTKEKEREKL